MSYKYDILKVMDIHNCIKCLIQHEIYIKIRIICKKLAYIQLCEQLYMDMKIICVITTIKHKKYCTHKTSMYSKTVYSFVQNVYQKLYIVLYMP